MRDDEVCSGILMVLLMNGCGDYEGVKGLKIQIRYRLRAIAQLSMVIALANIRCRPLGNFSRLPFGGSVNNQDFHDVTRIVTNRRDHGESRCNLLDQRNWNFGQVDNLCGDRAQKEALNSTKTAGAHYDVHNVFLTSYLRYHFRNLTGSDERLESDVGMFAFSCRVLKSLGRRSRACLTQPVGISRLRWANSMARMFCTLSSTSEVPGF